MPRFTNVKDYWESRYKDGMTSGSGSYGVLAKYKASVLNTFVEANSIKKVVEWGCGDGAQLELSRYPFTLGLDISKTSIKTCMQKFKNDSTKSFLHYDPEYIKDIGLFIQSDLCLSLDVVYHLVENDIYHNYMENLFSSSNRFVIIYSSNSKMKSDAPHVKHREFTKWVKKEHKEFNLKKKIDNPYFPFDPNNHTSTTFAEFYIFEKQL